MTRLGVVIATFMLVFWFLPHFKYVLYMPEIYDWEAEQSSGQPEEADRSAIEISARSLIALAVCVGALSTALVGQLMRNNNDQSDKQIAKSERITRLLANALDVSPDMVTGENLKDVSELPGYQKDALPDDSSRKLLKKSAVVILSRQKGSLEYWNPVCSGNKVRIGSSSAVATADHCLSYQVTTDEISAGKALDVTPRTTEEFAVGRYAPDKHSPDDQHYEIIGTVGKIAAFPYLSGDQDDKQQTDIPDLALLQVKPTVQSQLGYYNSMPALNAANRRNPLQGEAVFSYSLPIGKTGKSDYGSGLFIGSSSNATARNQFVVFNTAPERISSMTPGSSGSFGISKSGALIGPLSFTNNDPQYLESEYNYEYGGIGAVQDKLELEASTGVDLSKFEQVAGYTARKYDSFGQLFDVIDKR